jgi:hypothetical protein
MKFSVDGVLGLAYATGWQDGWLRFRLMVRTRSARSGLKHQRRNAAMEHYAGLDVSVKETSVCVVDGAG